MKVLSQIAEITEMPAATLGYLFSYFVQQFQTAY